MKNIKVITGVIATLGIFSALLLVTGILFYSAVSSDRLNFQNASALSYQQQELGGSFQTLIETRVTINRVAIRMLKNQRDPASLDAMNTLLTTLARRSTKRKTFQQLRELRSDRGKRSGVGCPGRSQL